MQADVVKITNILGNR